MDPRRQLAEDAVAWLMESQQKLSPLLNRRLSFDFLGGRALYLSEAGGLVEVKAAPICSYGAVTGSCQWAWANNDLAGIAAPDAAAAGKLAGATGFDHFTRERPFGISGEDLRSLVALAIRHIGGLGTLLEDSEQNTWMFTVTAVETDEGKIKIASDEIPALLEKLVCYEAVAAFNALRARFPGVLPILAGADLRGAPSEGNGDLLAQPAIDNETIAVREPKILDGIDFSMSRLDGTNLRGVRLRGASFRRASLIDADLTGADLADADFSGAFLNGANFTSATLGKAIFENAELGRTLLIDTDLSATSGLETTHHSAGSEISFSALVNSGFQIAESFMRATGVSSGLLDDLRRGKRFGCEYGTCFLSYSTKDTSFATKLYDALIDAGVRVFWDCKDADAAERLPVQFEKAIRESDRLIAVFSDASVVSPWIKREVETALYYKPAGFTPIRICGIEPIRAFVGKHEIKPDIVDGDACLILDFTRWQDEKAFAASLAALLKSIRR